MRNAIVYLSSTVKDLKAFREEALRTLLQLGYRCKAMEQSVASDERPLDQCLRDVEASSIYLGIFAWRYGYRPRDPEKNKDNLSITELEYRHAVKLHKPRYLFLLPEDAAWRAEWVDGVTSSANESSGEDLKSVVTLRKILLEDRVVSLFSSQEELGRKIVIALGLSARVPRPPQFQGMPLPLGAAHFSGRAAQIKELESYLHNDKTAVAWITGDSGIGKSHFVQAFLDRISSQRPAYSGCQWKYAWSFYNQGAHNVESSSSEFFADIFRYYGFDRWHVSEDQRVTTLVELLRTESTVLVLDGLDPLLEEKGGMRAHFRNGAMQRFLEALCAKAKDDGFHRGLVIVTSRLPAFDTEAAAAYGDAYRLINVDCLDDAEGADLLKKLLPSKHYQQGALEKLSGMANGQPLGLTLLGLLASKEFDGDIEGCREVLNRKTDKETDCATKVLQWHYAKWTRSGASSPTAEMRLSFMRILSLFSRPVAEVELNALISARADVAQALFPEYGQTRARSETASSGADEDGTARTQGHLQDTGLLVRKPTGEWDTHPTVRRFFRKRFKEEQPDTWRKAHDTLFGYFVQAAKEQPETEGQVEVVSRAIHHGALCGRMAEAFELYEKRVARGRQGFITENLGLVSWDLAMLSKFFPGEADSWWSGSVAKELDKKSEAWLLSRASYDLELVGRLDEAKQVRSRTAEYYQNVGDLLYCADAKQKLALMIARTGDLAEAEKTAREAVAYAVEAVGASPLPGESMDAVWDNSIHAHTVLGAILYRRGCFDDAYRCFQDAEKLAPQQSKDYPAGTRVFLHSEPGARYLLFLLDRGCMQNELRDRINWMDSWQSRQRHEGKEPSHLVISVHHLSKGRYYVARGKTFWDDAAREFDDAVREIERAHNRAYQCQPLLARADLNRRRRRYEEALADLKDVLRISEQMVLYEVQARLLQAATYLDLASGHEETTRDPKTCLVEAVQELRACRILVDKTQYRLREPDLELLAVRRKYAQRVAKEECLAEISSIENRYKSTCHNFFRNEAERVKEEIRADRAHACWTTS